MLLILPVTAALLLLFASVPENPPIPEPVPAGLSLELRFATYWGSGPADLRAIAFDPAGNVIAAGGSPNPDWPRTRPRFGPGGGSDIVVGKWTPGGAQLWSVVIGGTGEDYAYVAATNAVGEIYVGGRSGPDFPTTPGAFTEKFSGGTGGGPHGPTDGFLLKLSPTGDLLAATQLGGTSDDNIRAIEVLRSGKVAVAGGNTLSKDLPTDAGELPGPVLKPHHGGRKDAFVAVFHPNLDKVDFVTYFGPNDDDRRTGDETIRSLGEAPNGELWLGGTTWGTDLQPTPDAFQKVRGAGKEAYIARISSDGRELRYFSWLGGEGGDEIETEGTADEAGDFYVAGATTSRDFPTTEHAHQRELYGSRGRMDGWVARISLDGSLGMATLYGGFSSDEALFGAAVGPRGNVYAAGPFHSPDLVTTQGALQPRAPKPGGWDVNVGLVVFDSEGRLQYATYLGGSGYDGSRHVAVHRSGTVAVAIETNSEELLLMNAAQDEPAGAYLAVFAPTARGSSSRHRDLLPSGPRSGVHGTGH